VGAAFRLVRPGRPSIETPGLWPRAAVLRARPPLEVAPILGTLHTGSVSRLMRSWTASAAVID
jgi:hypothetical protein